MPGTWADAERAVIRRARLRVGVLLASVITVLVTAVGAIAYTVLVQGQNAQIERELWYSTEETGVPPACTWLFDLSDGVVSGGPGPVPEGFPLSADMDSASVSGAVVERTVERNGTTYHVRSRWRPDGHVVQAVLDARYQMADRGYLLRALALAEFGGLVVAVLTGLLVGRRAVAPLAEALRRERRFVTDASHELRTPITQAYTRLQALLRRAERDRMPAEHREGMDRLGGTLRRLGEIVDDLLLSARMGAGPTARDGPPVDLVEIAESIAAAESDRLAERGLSFTFDRPGDALLVRGVDSALRRAVGELIANAISHTPSGGRIELSIGRRTGGEVEVTVVDTGPGFDPADTEWIFSRFRHGPHGEGRRFGLGLALTREVVTSHGGTIEAVGFPGRGARFTIRLPEVRPGLLPRSRPEVREPSP